MENLGRAQLSLIPTISFSKERWFLNQLAQCNVKSRGGHAASRADKGHLLARDGHQVVTHQRVFNGMRHIGWQGAQHGAPERIGQRHLAPTWRAGAARPCGAHSAHEVAKACAACSGHSPCQCQLPMSKVMPRSSPVCAWAAKSLHGGQRTGSGGLVVLDHQLHLRGGLQQGLEAMQRGMRRRAKAANRHLQARRARFARPARRAPGLLRPARPAVL